MESTILQEALNKMDGLNGLQFQILTQECGIERIDAQILLKSGENELKYNVVLKTKIVPAQFLQLKEQMQNLTPSSYIVIAEYITTQAKEILRKENIPYIDTAGNVFIAHPNLYLFIETNKSNRKKLNSSHTAFTNAGLKVIYQFLVHPDYLNKPYRFIGKKAQVTIDTVGKVFKGLLKEKYIVKIDNKSYQFINRTQLFQEWVTVFNKNFRPKINQKKYRFLDKRKKWRSIKLPNGTHWGGANAAEKMTDYLIANQWTLYTNQPFQELMKIFKIVPLENGTNNQNSDIVLIEKFWEDENKTDCIDPILVYADLINEPDPRYLETAHQIFEEYVKDKL